MPSKTVDASYAHLNSPTRRCHWRSLAMSEFPQNCLAGFAAIAFHSYLVDHDGACLPVMEPICPSIPWQNALSP